ncbi:beta-ketoacyl synthase N-terminal-like domain-containing protein [Moorena sp. SIO4G3]|uniref:beta-ketoacyl synthase N-terminal-like domain-containing protein n=1 Tax=Moorena sp. SIO4G3 TaxID=2607821 RepID=UPI00142AFDBE|nr:beta-ketoacyl synthase N-terminal-like domain-containing protein [Moorena sp. SIO4G3]NEO77944.1 acyltransferase domain-containing protein [Moorena sp. SIO4G3]
MNEIEPIAIIGIGCRLPGAKTPEAFWQLLRNGVDAITEVPPERWDIDTFYDPSPATSGKMYTRWGGFLEQVDRFEPSFFGISPREAQRLDPQQRLLLEVVWEALENAAIVPESLARSQTGVFIGISNADYHRLIYKDFSGINAYSGTGTASSVAANRLSYVLNLFGPSVAIDTACSSSLVALHYACGSLLSLESNLCLVGAVNLMLSPEQTITFSQAQMMAADGRCKTFDASADGYVRGEGCGVVVLKRLSDALRDGDNIQAIVRGSAVNQDGLTNGLTAPNGPSQQAVIRKALEKAGVKPAQISYIEAHGTGTALGDPIEVKSLKAVLMEDREPDQPCWIGSVKTNIGHLEAAAGIAGLIKVVLSLQHGEIPPNLHLKELNPYIRIKNTPLSIPTELQKWPAGEKPRLAGVSSFGFGGTNGHIILEEAPKQFKSRSRSVGFAESPLAPLNKGGKSKVKSEEFIERPCHILTLSGKCEKALLQLAQRYQQFLDTNPTTSIADICFTANTGRSHFKHRLAVVAQSTEQLRQQLKAIETVGKTTGLVRGQVTTRKRPKIAFLFTGQGSQYVNMGRELYEQEPIFRKTLEQCDTILRLYQQKPLLSVLYPEPGETSPIDETAYTQPALFAIEYALAQLWKSWGIEPDVVMGHSVGEYVAACVAGVFSLEDGLKLIASRGSLMQALPADGEMVAVLASLSQVQEAIEPYAEKVAIAAINSPESVVISGQTQSVQAIIAALKTEGVKTKKLKVSHAFHSHLMKPMLADFEQIAKEVTYSSPQVNIISNVTGGLATAEIGTPEYWCRHILQPVRFAAGMETLYQQGYRVFLEIGPKPTLLGMGRHCSPGEEANCRAPLKWLPSLCPGQENWQQILQSLAQLYVRGVKVDWSSFNRHSRGHRLQLPTYPWQRQRYWIETAENGHQKAGSLSQENTSSPLFNLLHQGEIKLLTNQLKKVGELSEDEVKLLPKLLELLVKQHQQQLQAASIANMNGASELNQESVPLNTVVQEADWSRKRNELLAAEPRERRRLLELYLSQLLAKVMGISASELDWQQHLSTLGFDSLMATELRKQIEDNWEVMVPVEYFAELSLEQFLTQVLFLIEQKYPTEHLQAVDSTLGSQEAKTHSVAAFMPQANLWFKPSELNSKARFRLFCFPYAGAGNSIFHSWSEKLPKEIEICPLQLPGRENRLGESPFTRLKPLIQTLTTLLHPHLDIPFAFFGHSMGALLGFELARELRRRNWPCPVHLFVSGSRAPQLPDPEPPIHCLPELKFKQKLKRLNGIPEEVLQNADLMQLFLPTLRADFAILETYFYTNEQPLDFPISAFGGLQDSKISREEIAAWRQQTHRDFTLQMFSGDHFFLNVAGDAVVQTISQKLFQLPKAPSLQEICSLNRSF